MSKTKYQRVSEKDAITILEKEIDNHKDPCFNSFEYIEDYAGGSRQFINRDVVESLIKKLTR